MSRKVGNNAKIVYNKHKYYRILFKLKRVKYLEWYPRHSFATTMLDRDVDLIYIGQLLDHESLDTTKMYTHYANPKLKRIYDMAMCQ